MENCLVTRLKATVDNPDLEYFDALQFEFDWTNYAGGDNFLLMSNASGTVFGGSGVKVKILSNGFIRETIDGVVKTYNEYIIPSSFPSNSGCSIAYNNPLEPTEFLLIGLSKIQILSFNYNSAKIALRNPAKLKYCSNLGARDNAISWFSPYPENIGCDVSDYFAGFKDRASVTGITYITRPTYMSAYCILGSHAIKDFVSLTEITRNTAVVYGHLSDFASCSQLTKLQIGSSSWSGNKVTGDITDIANLTLLQNINVNNTSVQGSLDEFAAAQYANGRKTATNIKVTSQSTLTYLENGTVKTVPTAGVYLSWTDGGTAPVVTVTRL